MFGLNAIAMFSLTQSRRPPVSRRARPGPDLWRPTPVPRTKAEPRKPRPGLRAYRRPPGAPVARLNGDGTFQEAQFYVAGPFPSSVAAGDFNGDGYPDLAVADNIVTGTVTILINAANWP